MEQRGNTRGWLGQEECGVFGWAVAFLIRLTHLNVLSLPPRLPFRPLSLSLTLWICHSVPLCVHLYRHELEERKEGRITEACSVDVLCVAATVECPSLTLRR